MQHIGVDLGKSESQVCVRTTDGRIVEERKLPTMDLERFLRVQPASRVILETGCEAFHVADAALRCRHEVRVVPSTLVRSLGVGARRTKTDRRDAQALSEASCRTNLPSVHVPSHLARRRRTVCGMREELIASCVALINCVRGWTRTQLSSIRTGERNTFPERVRDGARHLPGGLPGHVDRLLIAIEALNEQIVLADKELTNLAKEDPLCRRLMSVPGVGPVTSLRFAAALDDATRFPNAHAVQAYLGLTPGQNSSSERTRRTGVTKAGPAALRGALVQAAWNLRRFRPDDPISRWAQRIENRRGRLIATTAVARKLAGVLYAIWRDGSSYEAEHALRKAE